LERVPIILGKPSACDQFNNLHKESVPIINAETPHSDLKHFLCSQFILSVLPKLAGNKDSWVADHAIFVFDDHAQSTALSGAAQCFCGPAAPASAIRSAIR